MRRSYIIKLGDCVEEMKNLPGGCVDLILTDPPYGITHCAWDTIIPFDSMWEQIWRVLKYNGVCALFGCEPFSSLLVASQIKYFKYRWVWIKHHATGHLNAKKRPMKISENILVFYKKQITYNPQNLIYNPRKMKNSYSDRQRCRKNITSTVSGNMGEAYNQEYTNYPNDILRFDSCNGNALHPTQKPIDLLEYLIKTYTDEGETVLDFTMGSGSTGVAAINTGRKFVGIEINTKYFEIAKQRITHDSQ